MDAIQLLNEFNINSAPSKSLTEVPEGWYQISGMKSIPTEKWGDKLLVRLNGALVWYYLPARFSKNIEMFLAVFDQVPEGDLYLQHCGNKNFGKIVYADVHIKHVNNKPADN